jgi:XTP/dITP diphosphohydrolase
LFWYNVVLAERPAMHRIYVATSNAGKLRDFKAAAAPFSVEIEPVPGFNSLPPVTEDAPTFEGNAQKKAEFYSRHASGEPVLADDSGLEVDALDGAPGVLSARYAADPNQPNASDAENNAKLLRELAEVPDDRRSARFVCTIALAEQGRTIATFRGEVFGRILREARGTGGFGYDPLFLFAPLNKTFAELTPEEKAQVSHRGHAFRRLLQWVLDAEAR